MKCKLLLDENLPPRYKLTRLNNRFNIRHIVHDYHKPSLPDKEIFRIAEKEGRVIITLNEKDFIGNSRKHSGLIGLSPNLSTEEIDKKLTSLLTRSKYCSLIGKFIHIHK